MLDHRGRKGSVENLLPTDRVRWAREIWAGREEVGKARQRALDAERGGLRPSDCLQRQWTECCVSDGEARSRHRVPEPRIFI